MGKMTEEIRKKLFEMQDLEYKAFHGKLIPTVSPTAIIGVRTPMLRAYAKALFKGAKTDENFKIGLHNFLADLPHKYYEENNLHAFLIEAIKDYDECMYEINRFLPYVDNWATCDMFNPKVVKKYTDKFLKQIEQWIASNETYTIRFAMGMLMRYYLDDLFHVEYLDYVSDKTSDEYYVNMMRAWFFATALAKQYEKTLPYIKENRLDEWTHNKAIQKAVESNRISKEQKIYLRNYKRKLV